MAHVPQKVNSVKLKLKIAALTKMTAELVSYQKLFL